MKEFVLLEAGIEENVLNETGLARQGLPPPATPAQPALGPEGWSWHRRGKRAGWTQARLCT